jgi:hypothetical protein
MMQTVDFIKQKVVPILKEAGVTKSSIFGSYVRGEQRDDSDVDILIDLPNSKSLFDFVDLKLKLEDVLQKKVDLVEYDVIKPRIRDQILNEQIQIL